MGLTIFYLKTQRLRLNANTLTMLPKTTIENKAVRPMANALPWWMLDFLFGWLSTPKQAPNKMP
jgi:hypothetical protein